MSPLKLKITQQVIASLQEGQADLTRQLADLQKAVDDVPGDATASLYVDNVAAMIDTVKVP